MLGPWVLAYLQVAEQSLQTHFSDQDAPATKLHFPKFGLKQNICLCARQGTSENFFFMCTFSDFIPLETVSDYCYPHFIDEDSRGLKVSGISGHTVELGLHTKFWLLEW